MAIWTATRNTTISCKSLSSCYWIFLCLILLFTVATQRCGTKASRWLPMVVLWFTWWTRQERERHRMPSTRIYATITPCKSSSTAHALALVTTMMLTSQRRIITTSRRKMGQMSSTSWDSACLKLVMEWFGEFPQKSPWTFINFLFPQNLSRSESPQDPHQSVKRFGHDYNAIHPLHGIVGPKLSLVCPSRWTPNALRWLKLCRPQRWTFFRLRWAEQPARLLSGLPASSLIIQNELKKESLKSKREEISRKNSTEKKKKKTFEKLSFSAIWVKEKNSPLVICLLQLRNFKLIIHSICIRANVFVIEIKR